MSEREIEARFWTDRSGTGTVIGLSLGEVTVESWALHLEPAVLEGNHRELAERVAERASGPCVHLDDWGQRTTDECSRCSARRLLAAARTGPDGTGSDGG